MAKLQYFARFAVPIQITWCSLGNFPCLSQLALTYARAENKFKETIPFSMIKSSLWRKQNLCYESSYLTNLAFQYLLLFSFTASVVIQCICYACNVQSWNRCFGCFPYQWRISRRNWTTTKTIRRCALQRSCVSAGRKITSNILWPPWLKILLLNILRIIQNISKKKSIKLLANSLNKEPKTPKNSRVIWTSRDTQWSIVRGTLYDKEWETRWWFLETWNKYDVGDIRQQFGAVIYAATWSGSQGLWTRLAATFAEVTCCTTTAHQ